jgi:hypothetical protein
MGASRPFHEPPKAGAFGPIYGKALFLFGFL